MPPSEAPPQKFTANHTLSEYTVPPNTYLLTHGQHESGLASGALVFDAEDRVLLIQRAAHDSMPNRWESPGGAIDDSDESILHGVARELWEESGLVAKSIEGLVGEGYEFFLTRGGLRVVKFTFVVEVESTEEVTLDANEHQNFVWATEEECRCGVVGGGKGVSGGEGEGLKIEFTTKAQRQTVLEGLRMRGEKKNERAGGT